jgi:excisionase family DNA binding protein
MRLVALSNVLSDSLWTDPFGTSQKEFRRRNLYAAEDYGMAIRDLSAHAARFVTVAELAEYWSVSRQQIYKRIESGALEAICLGSRLYRVRTKTALEYERQSSVNGTTRQPDNAVPPHTMSRSVKLPRRIGLQRVR